LVILSRGEGHFLPVNIETGIESGDWIEVVDGLLEGAEVAVNGQFLLDAAASLHDAAQRMQESHKH
jgi:Cu(I)/Ag(I) efflux system membrane fusion protein